MTVSTENLHQTLILGQHLCTKRYFEKSLNQAPILVKKSVFNSLKINGFNDVYNIWFKNKSIDFSVI